MNIAYTEEEYKQAKTNDKLSLKCKRCDKIFLKRKKEINIVLRGTKSRSTCEFCSMKCIRYIQLITKCGHCGQLVNKQPSEITFSKSGKSFCSKSCAATYHNMHKTTGNRRSKLEIWLEKQLTQLYPDFEILFNHKEAINSELDIYFPTLKLAFELNGIFHYEPIYGAEKLSQIQNNDDRKFQACLEHNIELCIINNSTMKNFKPQKAQKYLDIITNLVEKCRIRTDDGAIEV